MGNMGIKKGNKQEEIKIRLTKEQKDLIKRVAKQEGTTMSEFILRYMEPIALAKEFDFQHKDIIETRIENTEFKIQNLKRNMENRKVNKNKNLFQKIFSNKC